MSSIAKSFTKVYKKIGVICTRVSDLVNDYIDIESPSNIVGWQGKYLRRYGVKSDTPFIAGDIVSVSTIPDEYFLIATKNADYLLNQIVTNIGNLYVCNITTGTFGAITNTRDAATLEPAITYPAYASGVFGCIVPARIDVSSFHAMPIEDNNYFFYTSFNENIKRLDRFTNGSNNYIVETIDNISLSGCSILKLIEDTR